MLPVSTKLSLTMATYSERVTNKNSNLTMCNLLALGQEQEEQIV